LVMSFITKDPAKWSGCQNLTESVNCVGAGTEEYQQTVVC
jgi:hypothetical protein